MARSGFKGTGRSKLKGTGSLKRRDGRTSGRYGDDRKQPNRYKGFQEGPKRERPAERGFAAGGRVSQRPRADVKEKPSSGVDIPRLEGRNPIIEAMKAGRTIEKILVAKGSHEGSIRQLISMAREKGIVINEVERAKLDSLSESGNHQGVIAMVSDYKYVEVEDILKAASEKGEAPFILILDEINDPFNFGSLLRSANAAGVHGVIIPKRRAVGLTPIVAKASAGAIEYANVAKVTNISGTIEELKKRGIWIVGADMGGEKAYYEADLTGPVAVVIGSEGEGIGKLIKGKCDFLVKLPMRGEISSLNAGVAGGILMYEIMRQRTIKG